MSGQGREGVELEGLCMVLASWGDCSKESGPFFEGCEMKVEGLRVQGV